MKAILIEPFPASVIENFSIGTLMKDINYTVTAKHQSVNQDESLFIKSLAF